MNSIITNNIQWHKRAKMEETEFNVIPRGASLIIKAAFCRRMRRMAGKTVGVQGDVAADRGEPHVGKGGDEVFSHPIDTQWINLRHKRGSFFVRPLRGRWNLDAALSPGFADARLGLLICALFEGGSESLCNRLYLSRVDTVFFAHVKPPCPFLGKSSNFP